MRYAILLALTGALTGCNLLPEPSLERKCAAGDAFACFRAGETYAEGETVEQDFGRAKALWVQGCDGGEAQACLALVVAEKEGHFGTPDPAARLGWLDKACADGSAKGCTLRAERARADGDAAAEAKAWKAGCELGDDHACNVVDGNP